MSTRFTLAVAGRVLTQIRRDHRTLALLLIEAAGSGEDLLANVTDARVEALKIPRRGTLRALPMRRVPR